MTNTAHRHCTHPATKTDRARCRRANGKAVPGTTVKPAGHRDRHIVETCSCRGPLVEGTTCTLCDRPVDTMTALGLVLVA